MQYQIQCTRGKILKLYLWCQTLEQWTFRMQKWVRAESVGNAKHRSAENCHCESRSNVNDNSGVVSTSASQSVLRVWLVLVDLPSIYTLVDTRDTVHFIHRTTKRWYRATVHASKHEYRFQMRIFDGDRRRKYYIYVDR